MTGKASRSINRWIGAMTLDAATQREWLRQWQAAGRECGTE
jgi:hypothetical protein